MSRLKGVIDLGSNSFKLLVGAKENGQLQKIIEEKVFVDLPKFIDTGEALNKSEDTCISAIRQLIEIGKESDCHSFQLIATSYFRNKENHQWLQDILKKAGINEPLKLISGEKEAEYISKGVLIEIDQPDFLIMDIGGGSVEFIGIKNRSIQTAQSFDVGVRRWAEQYDTRNGLSEKDAQTILQQLKLGLHDFLSGLKNKILVGSAGSFETFYSFKEEKVYHPHIIRNYTTSINDLSPYLKSLMNSTEQERYNHPFIENARVKFLPFAALITEYVIQTSEVEVLKVAANALKEGALLDWEEESKK